MDDPIANFMAMTGCDEDLAIEFLSSEDFDLTRAVVRYQGGGTAAATAAATATPPAPSPPMASGLHVVSSSVMDPYSGDDLGSHSPDNFSEPSPTTLATSHVSPTTAAAQAAPSRAFPSHPPVDSVVENPQREPFAEPTPNREVMMRRLFSSPSYVVGGESFQKARRAAERADKWMLVAVVEGAFQVACLSRDVWNDPVMPTVSESLQCVVFDSETQAGQACLHDFRIDRSALPSLFLVDPITSHKEKVVKVTRERNGAFKAASIIEQVLYFIGENGSPRQRFEATVAEHIDVDGEEEEGRAAQGGPSAAAAAAPLREASHPPPVIEDEEEEGVDAPAPAPVAAVDLDEWTLPDDDGNGFRIRVRLPRSGPVLCLRPTTPASLLLRYLAYRVHAESPETYPAPPSIEVRTGFPPKSVPAPDSDDTPISAWQGIRAGDNVTVHILL